MFGCGSHARRPIFLILPILLIGPPAGAQSPGAARADPARFLARATRANEPPRLDGVLDEAAWQEAVPFSGFVQREPAEGEPATEATEVRVLYTRDTLYLGFRCEDSDVLELRANQLRWDGDQSGDDRIEIILDTFADGRNSFAFRFTALGAQWDAQVRDSGQSVSADWDGVWFVRTSMERWGWSAEVAIPFATLRFPRAEDHSWGFNVQRVVRRKNEESFWTPVRRGSGVDQSSDGKYRTGLAGRLVGLSGIRAGSSVELRPWGLGSADSRDGLSWQEGLDHGLDARYRLTSNLTADLTLNTDFAQVEADQEQINLDRFDLYFPEKREFFLEGRDIFKFGMGEYNAAPPFFLFYSRRVGLARVAGETRGVPLQAGVRLTGKERGWTVGALAVRTGSFTDRDRLYPAGFIPPATPPRVGAASLGVLRLSRDLLTGSRAGMLAAGTDQGLDGRAYAAWGLDGQIRLGRNSQLEAFAAFSRNGNDRPAPAGAVNYAWTTDLWAVEASNLYVDPEWGDDLGFVARGGVMRNKLGITWSPRPDLPGVRQTLFFVDTSYFTRPDGTLESRLLNPGGIVLFQNGARLIYGAALRYERVESPFRLGDILIEPAAYRFASAFIHLSSDRSRSIGTTSQVSGGSYFQGDRRTYLSTVWWRPSAWIGAEWIWESNRVWAGPEVFRGVIRALRLTWTPTTTLTTKLFTQTNTADEVGNTNILLDWRYRPRSHLYLVYNTSGRTFSGVYESHERILMLKLIYLLNL